MNEAVDQVQKTQEVQLSNDELQELTEVLEALDEVAGGCSIEVARCLYSR